MANYADETDYLECVPWDGQENSLPGGVNIGVRGVTVVQLVKAVTALVDAEPVELAVKEWLGLKERPPIIDVLMGEAAYQRIIKIRGPDAFRIMPPDGGKYLNRVQWKAKYGTDGLVLQAIKDLMGYGGPHSKPYVIK